ncbi:hypothetical protein KY334_02175, partial [Candidatus Woesearchaeota archaeon]|nr:hypothetical protein [Candidatus Woesearchaeota archaeon]
MRGMLKYLILLVLLSSLVFGIPNSDVSINPQELYETTSQQFNLTIDNLFKNEVIYNIELTTSNLQLINTTEFKGWN